MTSCVPSAATSQADRPAARLTGTTCLTSGVTKTACPHRGAGILCGRVQTTRHQGGGDLAVELAERGADGLDTPSQSLPAGVLVRSVLWPVEFGRVGCQC